WSFFFQAEDGIRDFHVTGVQTCALPIYHLLIRMNVVTKITQAVAEFLHIRLEQTNLACDINKFSKSPIWKLLYLALLTLRTGSRSEERRVGKECRARGRTTQ